MMDRSPEKKAFDPVLSLISLAKKAGGIKCGTFLSEDSIRSKKAKLVVISEDMSEREAKELKALCKRNAIPFIIRGTKESLGECTGKGLTACAAVVDENLARGILKKI